MRKDLPENSFVSIEAYHMDLKGQEHTFVPQPMHCPMTWQKPWWSFWNPTSPRTPH